MRRMVSWNDQSAAIPWRRRAGRIEICMIRWRGSGKWIVPKGGIEGDGPRRSAAREAEEEAGVRGRLGERIGAYRRRKSDDSPCHIRVFLLEVTEELDEWEEHPVRQRRWFRIEEAMRIAGHRGLKPLLRKAARRLGRG